MPTTVNGIGTHYYGKKNRVARAAVCRSCGHYGELLSYDTRLWFVVVFIPIIPLGRKRILDACPACRRHFVAKAAEYEQSKQLQTSESLDRYRREPSPDAAAEAHARLIGFHEHEQADDLRRDALARFPDHAGLRAWLAEHLWETSDYEGSRKLFDESHRLDPDAPEGRVGVARFRAADGDLDEAMGLLDFLTEPGAGSQHSLQPLDFLADRLQAVGRHEDALKLAGVLRREIPTLDDVHAFRAFVRKSEKALKRPESILSRRPFSIAGLFRSEGSPYPPWVRKAALGGIALALIAGGLAANNEYIRRHRTLHVLNATGATAQVRVDDGPPVPVDGMGRLTVSEGPHVVKISGPVEETHQVALQSEYFERWTHSPVWIVNPGGEAVVDQLTHTYQANGGPSRRDRLVGRPVIHVPHVDYLFTPAPDRLQTKSNQPVVKTEVEWAQGEDVAAFLEASGGDRQAAMSFAEGRLRRGPDPDLLRAYLETMTRESAPRGLAFLKSGIDHRPVDVGWHRAYQSMCEALNDADGLIPYYDQLLQTAPNDAALLYLRGRVEPDWEAQASYYTRAIEADPKQPWPRASLASQAAAEGRWDDALKLAAEAVERGFDDPEGMAGLVHTARLAKGEADTEVDAARAALAATPLSLKPLERLLEALAASGRAGEIDGAITSWAAPLPPDVQSRIIPHLKSMGLYIAGRGQEAADYCASQPELRTAPENLHALLAIGRAGQAAEDEGFAPLWEAPSLLLSLSVGLGLDGRTDDAASRREQAAAKQIERAGVTDYGKAGRLLAAAEAPSTREVVRLYIDPDEKAMLMAALAQKHPAEAGRFLAEAARYDVLPKLGHLLLQRAVAGRTPATP